MLSELQVAAGGAKSNRFDDFFAVFNQFGVLAVGQSLNRRDGNRVSGVNAHRVLVFNRADDDAVAGAVSHEFHFQLFPAQKGLFNENFMNHGRVQAAFGDVHELFAVVRYAAAGSAQGERRSNNTRQSDVFQRLESFVHVVRQVRAGQVDASRRNRRAEIFAVFRMVNDFRVRAEHFNSQLVQNAHFRDLEPEVKTRLTAQRGQNGVWTLFTQNSR